MLGFLRPKSANVFPNTDLIDFLSFLFIIIDIIPYTQIISQIKYIQNYKKSGFLLRIIKIFYYFSNFKYSGTFKR